MRDWWGKYIGKPYTLKSCGPHAYDCWGLVKAVYQNELGIELPAYGEISARDLLRIARTMAYEADCGERWRAVDMVRPFDVALMTLTSATRVGHVGVVVRPGWVLHVETATHVTLTETRHYSIKHRITGYRRYKT